MQTHSKKFLLVSVILLTVFAGCKKSQKSDSTDKSHFSKSSKVKRGKKAVDQSADAFDLDADSMKSFALDDQLSKHSDSKTASKSAENPIFSWENLNAEESKHQFKTIYFDFDKDLIRDESVIELSKLYYFMTSNPDMVVEVAGHTDSRGTDEYNIDLSKRRAKSVQAWLTERGIKAKRIVTKGYGEAKPIADNVKPDGSDDPDGRQMNRRIELTILSIDGKKIITTEGK